MGLGLDEDVIVVREPFAGKMAQPRCGLLIEPGDPPHRHAQLGLGAELVDRLPARSAGTRKGKPQSGLRNPRIRTKLDNALIRLRSRVVHHASIVRILSITARRVLGKEGLDRSDSPDTREMASLIRRCPLKKSKFIVAEISYQAGRIFGTYDPLMMVFG